MQKFFLISLPDRERLSISIFRYACDPAARQGLATCNLSHDIDFSGYSILLAPHPLYPPGIGSKHTGIFGLVLILLTNKYSSPARVCRHSPGRHFLSLTGGGRISIPSMYHDFSPTPSSLSRFCPRPHWLTFCWRLPLHPVSDVPWRRNAVGVSPVARQNAHYTASKSPSASR
jgi:hypothetical protein